MLVPLYLGQEKLKFSGVWFVKKGVPSVKMQVRNLKFNRLKDPKHPQVSDCPEIFLYSVGTIPHQGAEHASAHSGRKKGGFYDLYGH